MEDWAWGNQHREQTEGRGGGGIQGVGPAPPSRRQGACRGRRSEGRLGAARAAPGTAGAPPVPARRAAPAGARLRQHERL